MLAAKSRSDWETALAKRSQEQADAVQGTIARAEADRAGGAGE